MDQEFIIKKSPLQKIIVKQHEFEIINHQYKNENGVFKYSKLNQINFKEKSTNYLKTILITLLNFIFEAGDITKAKNKERIQMNYDGQEVKFILFDFDKDVVMEAISEIRKRTN